MANEDIKIAEINLEISARNVQIAKLNLQIIDNKIYLAKITLATLVALTIFAGIAALLLTFTS
jgi:hypothetical protein